MDIRYYDNKNKLVPRIHAVSDGMQLTWARWLWGNTRMVGQHEHWGNILESFIAWHEVQDHLLRCWYSIRQISGLLYSLPFWLVSLCSWITYTYDLVIWAEWFWVVQTEVVLVQQVAWMASLGLAVQLLFLEPCKFCCTWIARRHEIIKLL